MRGIENGRQTCKFQTDNQNKQGDEMNVAEITMPKEDAIAKVNAYRNGLRRRADAEYKVALTAYEELAAGRTLINIDEVFATADLNEDGFPNIAIGRADRIEVRADRRKGETNCEFSTSSDGLAGGWRRWPGMTIDCELSEPSDSYTHRFALLPMVPPEVRPKGQLKEYHILWEVNHWSKRSQSRIAPYDPILLKYLTGPLYVVMGTWNLTEVERCIVAGRVSA